MADLEPLIRVRKHVVEQKQKFLAELYRQADELEGQKTVLLAQREEERERTAGMGVEMLSYFGPYSDAIDGRVLDIDEAVDKLNTRIEIAREDMREAFAELKKVEITQEAREAKAQAAQDKKDTAELDEIGINSFNRNKAETNS